MSLQIHVEVPFEEVQSGKASAYLECALSAIGFVRCPAPAQTTAHGGFTPEEKATIEAHGEAIAAEVAQAREIPGVKSNTSVVEPEPKVGEQPDTGPLLDRLIGKSTGARRTKVEIAEDDSLTALGASVGVTVDQINAVLAKGATRKAVIADIYTKQAELGEKPASEPAAAISASPEDRVGPEDSVKDQKQDAADEAAESAAKKTTGEMTISDVMQLGATYMRKYGMAAASSDVPAVLGCKLADVEPSAAPAAYAMLLEAIDANPFGREVKVAGTPAATPKADDKPTARTATKDELFALMQAYVKEVGPEKGNADSDGIFAKALGLIPAGTKKANGELTDKWVLSAVPDHPEAYGACVTAWEKALADVRTERDA